MRACSDKAGGGLNLGGQPEADDKGFDLQLITGVLASWGGREQRLREAGQVAGPLFVC